MKSMIVAVSFLLVAVSASPLAVPEENSCHPFKPENPRPNYAYAECDLACVLDNKDVVCSFDIAMMKRQAAPQAQSKMQLENKLTNVSASSDAYVCISPKSIDLDSLPLVDRSQCVKCTVTEDKTPGSLKSTLECENLSGKPYSADSVFTLEAYVKDKPVVKDNFEGGAIWKVPYIQPADVKLNMVKVDMDVNDKGIHYKIHTSFQ